MCLYLCQISLTIAPHDCLSSACPWLLPVFFHIPTLNVFPNSSTYLSILVSLIFYELTRSLPFSFIRALHPLPPLFILSCEHRPNITIQELPFTLLLGWHHGVCPVSWHMCVFPGKYLNDFILPTNLLNSLEMLQNSGLEMIFPQDFEGIVVLSGMSGGMGTQILFMWPCFVGLLFFLFLSLEALRIFCPWCCGISWWCSRVWVFFLIYLSGYTVDSVITSPCTSVLGHFLLVFLWGGFPPHIFFLFDPFS